MTQANSAGPAIVDLLSRLGPEPDEAAVVSLVGRRGDDQEWHLVLGSVLIGPDRMTGLSWHEWLYTDSLRKQPWSLGVYGVEQRDWRTFDYQRDDLRYIRFSIPVQDLAGWLSHVMTAAELVLPGGAPLRATVQAAEALLRVFRHVDTPTGLLAAAAGRPVLGWVHPVRPTVSAPQGLPATEISVVAGKAAFDFPLTLLGLAYESIWGTQAAHGLLVGRLQRDAWFGDFHGGEAGLKTFKVQVRLDPVRIALWDLALDLEEFDRQGELFSARRVRLADLPVPEHGADAVTVELPALGLGLTRRVRLYDLDGRLLDTADRVILAETVRLSVTPLGAEPEWHTVGNGDPAPTFITRLQALDEMDEAYRKWLEEGAAGRVVTDMAAGLVIIKQRLAAARDELLIYDPYLGGDPQEWLVLDRVSCRVRVLTSRKANVPAGSVPANVELRVWQGKPTPFHDRGYLWRDGGISVGASQNGLGGRMFTIDVLEPAVVRRVTDLFNSWWADPLAQPAV